MTNNVRLSRDDKRSLRTPLVKALEASRVAAAASVTDTQLRATPLPVSGTVAVTGVATDAKLDTIITALDDIATLLTTIKNQLPAALDASGGLKTKEQA